MKNAALAGAVPQIAATPVLARDYVPGCWTSPRIRPDEHGDAGVMPVPGRQTMKRGFELRSQLFGPCVRAAVIVAGPRPRCGAYS